MAVQPTGPEWITAVDQGNAKGLYTRQADNLYSQQGGAPIATLTMLAGTVSAEAGGIGLPFIRVDTEAAAAQGDLTNVLVDQFEDGQLILIGIADASHVVTLKQGAGGAGQFSLYRGVDVTLRTLDDYVLCYINKQGAALLEEVVRYNVPASSEAMPAGIYNPPTSTLYSDTVVYTNLGAGGPVTMQLPPAQVDQRVEVSNADLAQLVTIAADPADTIAFEDSLWAGIVTTAGRKYSIKLVCLVPGRWDTITSHGPWVST